LPDELIAALSDGRLSEEELSHAHQHLAKCRACRELLAVIVCNAQGVEEGPAPSFGSTRPEIAHLNSSASWLPPGEFDEFRLMRPLGRGAMGIVYLAHDRSLNRQVALKFIASLRPNPRAHEHFQTEARAIARVQHPNVVTVFRVGEVDGHPYIVSEYLVGQSLSELSLPLPWQRVLGLGIELARGLAAAHRQGVLHRDIKPANVLLTDSGEVKLLDFGLAEFFDVDTSTKGGAAQTTAGTPRYMAPELFRGAPASPQSDLYSLGLVLYELCTGTPPSRSQREMHRRAEQPVSTSQTPPERDKSPPLLLPRRLGIDLDFALVIERCIRNEPDERFASAEALCTALERLRIQALDVHSTSNPYRGLAPFETEHRALFFGRDADIRAVLERLRRQSLVLIAGDSGVGKSSLCRAGILPRVMQGALNEHRNFSTLTLKPGHRPLAALAAALTPLLGQPEKDLVARFAETPQWLGPALRSAYQEGRGLLLFIDQLEELITLSEPAQTACFASLLGELALPSEGVRVLLTVRGDFFTRLTALPGLGTEVEQSLYLLRPLTPEGVREAITGPARSRGVAFESEGLLRTLTEATTRGAGSLPLLQFTLAQLWERRDSARGLLTQVTLDELGGVAGALSHHADAVLSRLHPAEQQTARRIFSRLTTAEGTRSERSEEELTAISKNALTVLQALVAGRLLHTRTTEGHASYEIAHEALITGWRTMRRWLDEDAGQRALQQRAETASAEWERSGRAAELLWRGRPLEEARALDLKALSAREQDFLRASQKAVHRQRQSRWLAALLFVLVVGITYFGPRVHVYLATKRRVNALLQDARSAHVQGMALDQQASTSRERAMALYDGKSTGGSNENLDLWARAEDTWAQALKELHHANDAYTKAAQALENILQLVQDHPEARRFLADNLRARIELAERFHQADESKRLIERFEQLAVGDDALRGWLTAPAELELVTDPPGASVELTRYVDNMGTLRREPLPQVSSHGQTPIAWRSLPAGSYHLRISREGRAPVDLPILLGRGKHERVELTLPTHVPEGYVYIPPGCFFSGSTDKEEVRRDVLESAPLHRVCLQEGYLIGRNEVTLGDWLEYLDTLHETANARDILKHPTADGSNRTLRVLKLPDGSWSFFFELPSKKVLQARAGQLFHYPGRNRRRDQDWRRFPLSNVSANDIQGYLDWLHSTGRLPGARLCSEWEWTRAARGADDRRYPHGYRLNQDDGNIDITYDRKDDDFGPDEVGSHPASVSVFGVNDMSGNVLEMTLAKAPAPNPSAIIQLGGAWYYAAFYASIANRPAGTPIQRDLRVGVRVCATFPMEHGP
jgi:serine/threonine protein kinase/formylglycine-generating enzyme required for sulfatase activity